MTKRLDNLRIVIVDDHEQVRSALTSFLSGLGSIVRECEKADDAITLVPSFQPDLVLSDIAMPDKDGIELLREIRSLDPSDGGEVPVIAITGLSSPRDQLRAPVARFDAVLLKPFTPEVLLQIILEVIQYRTCSRPLPFRS